MADPQGGREGTLADRGGRRRGRTSDRALEASIAVAELTDSFGAPTIADVAARLGLSLDATHQRMLAGADAGWLLYREGRKRAFAPSLRLWDYLRAADEGAP